MCNGSVTSPRSHNLTLGEVGFKPSLAPKRHSYSLHFAASNTTCVPLLGFSGLPRYLVFASILALVTLYSRIKWPPSPLDRRSQGPRPVPFHLYVSRPSTVPGTVQVLMPMSSVGIEQEVGKEVQRFLTG